MDERYTPSSPETPLKRRSVSNSHISLAPLTTRLPLRSEDYEAMNDVSAESTPRASYIYNQSAPTTPHITYRASEPAPASRSAARATPRHTSHNDNPNLAKSKSASHLPNNRTLSRRTPSTHAHHTTTRKTPPTLLSSFLPDTDVLMRVGSIIGSQAHETSLGSGPSWLISRASSASLSGGLPQSPEEYYALQDADEYTLAREKVFGSSRRGSRDYTAAPAPAAAAAYSNGRSPTAARSVPASAYASPVHSRFGSRSQSRVGGVGGRRSVGGSRPMTPKERRAEILAQLEDDYFGPVMGVGGFAEEAVPELAGIPGPDFVNLNEALEDDEGLSDEEEDLEAETEAYIRQAKDGFLGSWWMRLFMGDLKMFPSEEDEPAEEEYTEEISDEEFERQRQLRREASLLRLQECKIIPLDTTNDPPPMEDKGGWRDAAWLLGLAVKMVYKGEA